MCRRKRCGGPKPWIFCNQSLSPLAQTNLDSSLGGGGLWPEASEHLPPVFDTYFATVGRERWDFVTVEAEFWRGGKRTLAPSFRRACRSGGSLDGGVGPTFSLGGTIACEKYKVR